MKYKWACGTCDWTYKEQDNSPKFLNAPTRCKECEKDMMCKPMMETDLRDYSYEIVIQCKQNGVNMVDGFVLTNLDLSNRDPSKIKSKFITLASETLARMITSNQKLNQLVQLREV